MSKHYVSVTCQVIHDVQTMTSDQLEEQYGIEIDPSDGTVWDPCEYKEFDGVQQWAAFMQELEEDVTPLSSSKITKYRYNED